MLVHSLPPVAPDPRFDPGSPPGSRGGAARRAATSVTVTGLLAAASMAFVVGIASAALLFRHPAGDGGLAAAGRRNGRAARAPARGCDAPGRGPLMRADFMAGASSGIPLWSAASLLDDAPARFVSAQLTSASRRARASRGAGNVAGSFGGGLFLIVPRMCCTAGMFARRKAMFSTSAGGRSVGSGVPPADRM